MPRCLARKRYLNDADLSELNFRQHDFREFDASLHAPWTSVGYDSEDEYSDLSRYAEIKSAAS